MNALVGGGTKRNSSTASQVSASQHPTASASARHARRHPRLRGAEDAAMLSVAGSPPSCRGRARGPRLRRLRPRVQEALTEFAAELEQHRVLALGLDAFGDDLHAERA